MMLATIIARLFIERCKVTPKATSCGLTSNIIRWRLQECAAVDLRFA
jgi:hypothetical protein